VVLLAGCDAVDGGDHARSAYRRDASRPLAVQVAMPVVNGAAAAAALATTATVAVSVAIFARDVTHESTATVFRTARRRR